MDLAGRSEMVELEDVSRMDIGCVYSARRFSHSGKGTLVCEWLRLKLKIGVRIWIWVVWKFGSLNTVGRWS